MKSGFTVISLVLYVMLFFTFTVFATAISTNLNHRILSEKGKVIINENYMKLYTNLLSSAKKSTSVDIIQNKIVFSNGDLYEYNETNKKIMKNSGNLVQNIESYSIINVENSIGPFNDVNDIDLSRCFSINVSFRKYNQNIDKNVFITVGENLYE